MESESSLADAPVISPDLVGPPPRTTELTGFGITLLIATACIIAAALIWAGFLANEALQQFQIRSALRNANAETVGSVERIRNPRALKFYVDYTFRADGKMYAGEAIIPLQDVHVFRPAANLSISYLPENPAVNHPTDWEWSAVLELEAYFVLVVLVALGFFPFLPQLRIQQRLVAEGITTIGVVTKCSVNGRYGTNIKLKYDFRTRDDILLQGRGSFRTEQEIGAKILVLYLPGNPRKNIPYPLSTWRIAKR
jgi:hypothetical protein